MHFNLVNSIALLLVESFIFLMFYIALVNKKDFIRKGKVKCVLFILFYVVLIFFISMYLPLGIHTIAALLATILILSFVTRTNVYNAVIVIVVTGLFIAIIDTIVSGICLVILGIDLNSLMMHPLYYPMFAWTSKVVQIALALTVYFSKSEKLRINVLKSNSGQYMYVVIQLFLMTLFIGSINFSIGELKNKSEYILLMVLIYALSLILSIFDMKEREQIQNILNKKKILEEYVKNLEEVIQVIRREKHDFLNHVQTVYAICKLGKPNALVSIDNYLQRLTTDLKMSYRFFETGNDYIDGLLAIKNHICIEKDIDFFVNIGAQFTLAKADESDVAGIVGNIINNAIECMQSLPDSAEKRIEFITYIEKNKFFLRIANNGPVIPFHLIDTIFDKGVTTKSDNMDHGIGLYIVKQLVEKNKGKIHAASTSDITEFIMEFDVKEEMNADRNQYAAI